MTGLWFRLYTEISHDRKLRRLTPASRWLWIVLLAIAKESPCPGWLFLAEGVPVTLDDLADMAAISLEEVEAGLSGFVDQRMIEKADGVWRLLNWDKRQFVSDSGKERVQKYREKRKEGEAEPERYSDTAGDEAAALNNNTGYSSCNNVVTLQERYQSVTGNVTVTPPETETEIREQIKDLSSSSSSSSAPKHEECRDGQINSNEKPKLFGAFEQEFGRPLSPMEIEQIKDWAKECRELVILEALKRAALAGKYQFRYINGILANWLKNNLRTVQEINEHESAFKKRDGPEGGKRCGQGIYGGKRKIKPGYRPSEVDWANEPNTL